MQTNFDDSYEKLEPSHIRINDVEHHCLLSSSSGINTSSVVIDAHWHEWVEIIHVIEGGMVLEYQGKEIMVRENEYVIIGSQVLHRIVGEVGNYCFQCLHINLGFIIQNINASYFMNQVVKVKKYECFDNSFKKITELIKSQDPIDNLRYRANLLMLLSVVADEFGETMNAQQNIYPVNGLFEKMLFYINQHATTDITLAEVANVFSITPQYVSSLFKKYMSTTFFNYVTKYRLDLAKFLLYSTDDLIINIAYSCGFPNDHSFIYQFKKANGMTPAQYRKTKTFSK